MSAPDHTPEPWCAVVDIDGRHGSIPIMASFEANEDGPYHPRIACTHFGHGHAPREIAKANAERIVACVNACAGLNPAALGDLVKAAEELLEHIEACDEEDLLACDSDKHRPSVFSVLGDQLRDQLTALRNQQPGEAL